MSATQSSVVDVDKSLDREIKKNLQSLIFGSFPLINICSSEYDRLIHWIKKFFLTELIPLGGREWALYFYDNADGLYQDGKETYKIPGTTEIETALSEFLKVRNNAILVTTNLHLFWEDNYRKPKIIDFLFKIYMRGITDHIYLINIGEAPIPPELRHYFMIIDVPLPEEDTIREIILSYKDEFSFDEKKVNEAINICKGMTTAEIHNCIVFSLVMKEDLDLNLLREAKASIVKKSGLLEWINDVPTIEEVGGLTELKDWFVKIAYVFNNYREAKKYGIQIPKGCLLVGVPGTGKTLSAKAIASLFRVPLFRLDTSKLFSSLVGETERNVREALKQIDAMSPCVVLIDEIEKAFAGYHSSSFSDSGVTARLLGSFLYYFQEKKTLSYFVCTSNDISLLPPEMLRKGRFDEIWYISLPNPKERLEIWKIHLAKTGRKLSEKDLTTLVAKTEGFTGAEIEAVIQETLYHTFFEAREPIISDFISVINKVTPLSKREEIKIRNLEKWARENNIRVANAIKEENLPQRKEIQRKRILQ